MRNRNLDLLKIIACLMVIAVHVGTLYGMASNPNEPDYYFTIGNIFHSFPRTPVPLFVMISGAFLLANSKNKNVKSHYKKTFYRIILPTFWFSLGYTILSMLTGYYEQGSSFDFLFPIKSWILGWPYYHMWYMYMIIGCYASTPFLIRLYEKVGHRYFMIIGLCFLVFGLINYRTEILWPFKFIFYIGYFIMGYSLREWSRSQRISWKLCLGSSIIILIGMVIVTHYMVTSGTFSQPFYLLSSLSITVMMSAILMYLAFVKMPEIKVDISRLSKHTFYIYLFHAGVLDIIDFIVRQRLGLNPNPIWYLPVLGLVVFMISLQLAHGVEIIKQLFKRRVSTLEVIQ